MCGTTDLGILAMQQTEQRLRPLRDHDTKRRNSGHGVVESIPRDRASFMRLITPSWSSKKRHRVRANVSSLLLFQVSELLAAKRSLKHTQFNRGLKLLSCCSTPRAKSGFMEAG
jgi:hypothetical protein